MLVQLSLGVDHAASEVVVAARTQRYLPEGGAFAELRGDGDKKGQ
jgi:hypothetical protein